MKRTATKLLSLATLAVAMLAFTACGKDKFHVNGEIANAKDSMLYFEHNALDGFHTLDSLKLDETGHFDFKGDKADNPEFYRLRIAGQIINIAIDSTETVSVKASYPMMATDYTVAGSYENEKIKELALRQIELQNRCNAVAADVQLGIDSTMSVINSLIEQYKVDVTRNYIYKEPMKAYAYFALFQYIVVNGYPSLLFNPTEHADDIKVFGAVATSWDTYYPESERGENLHNIAIKGMKDQRIMQQRDVTLEVPADQVSEAGVIDLPLLDNKGKLHHLTDLKGQVVLLDFHVFESEGSTQYIMALRNIYNKYHAQGLEIYQVSLDSNEHFWKTQTAALPWICVHDDGSRSQAYLAPVTTVPIIYLIDRGNTIVKNPSDIKDLEAEIRNLL